jgi:hypothetical protein
MNGTLQTNRKINRQRWLSDLNEARSLHQLCTLVYQFGHGMEIEKKRWETKNRDEWENDVSDAKSISELCTRLLALENIMPRSSFANPWEGRGDKAEVDQRGSHRLTLYTSFPFPVLHSTWLRLLSLPLRIILISVICRIARVIEALIHIREVDTRVRRYADGVKLAAQVTNPMLSGIPLT